jgi:hypothetical protein
MTARFAQRRDVNKEVSSNDGKYFTDTEIAGLLGISLGRLRNKLCAGSPLPPRIQPPGCRNRLWPCQAVHDWLEQFTVTVADPTANNSPPHRRGRPSKQEARARR